MSRPSSGPRTTRRTGTSHLDDGTVVFWSVEETQQTSWRTVLVPRPGVSGPSSEPRAWLIVASMLIVFLAFVVGQVMSFDFHPVGEAVWALRGITVGLGMTGAWWVVVHLFPSPRQESWAGRTLVWLIEYAIVFAMLAVMTYTAGRGALAVANRILGTPGELEATVSGKRQSSRSSVLVFRETPELGEGASFQPGRPRWEATHVGETVRLEVRRSFVGTTLVRVSSPDDT